MKKRIKKILLFVIVLTIILSSFSIAFAVERQAPIFPDGNLITPYWTGLNTVSYDFDVLTGGQANPVIWGTTYSGAVDYVNVNYGIWSRFKN